jgi:hypothetical protein
MWITSEWPVIREYPMWLQWGERERLTFDADG